MKDKPIKTENLRISSIKQNLIGIKHSKLIESCGELQELAPKYRNKHKIANLLHLKTHKFSLQGIAHSEQFAGTPQHCHDQIMGNLKEFSGSPVNLERNNTKIPVIDMASFSESNSSTEKFIEGYLERAHVIQTKGYQSLKEVGELFEDLFGDLAAELPPFRTLFAKMQALTQILISQHQCTQNTTTRPTSQKIREISSLSRINLNSLQATPISTIIEKPPKLSRVTHNLLEKASPHIGRNHAFNKTSFSKNFSKSSLVEVGTKKVLIPKLNLAKLLRPDNPPLNKKYMLSYTMGHKSGFFHHPNQFSDNCLEEIGQFLIFHKG